jgi:hypothetical protein
MGRWSVGTAFTHRVSKGVIFKSCCSELDLFRRYEWLSGALDGELMVESGFPALPEAWSFQVRDDGFY